MVEDHRKSRKTMIQQESEATAEDAERVKAEVQAFIQQTEPQVMAWLTTLRKDGRPLSRPVATFVEGWAVGTISQEEHLKNRHIRKNPEVAYLWVELNPPTGQRPKSVFLQGKCEVIEDDATVQAFFKRRVEVQGKPDAHPDEDWKRLLLSTTPSIVRAEGFLGPLKPAVYRFG